MMFALDEHPLAADESTIAEKLLKALDDTGMTQVELAAKLAEPDADERRRENVRRLLNKWLSGRHLPSRKYALRLAEIFGTASGYFMANQPARGRADAANSEVGELLGLAWNASASRLAPGEWEEIPERFDKDFVAKQLARNFDIEHILVDEVDEWQPLEYARGRATLNEETLGLGRWYTDSQLIPGMVLLELLAQMGSIAMLTSPTFRKRLIFFAGFNQPRIKQVVNAESTLTVTAKLVELQSRIAHYETEARFEGTGELAARAVVILTAY